MKTTILLCLFALSVSAHAGIVDDIVSALPTGTHRGDNCSVYVSDSSYGSLNIRVTVGNDTVSANLSEDYDRNIESNRTATGVQASWTNMPDDGYTGKDKVKLSIAGKQVKIHVKDYGPIGVIFKSLKASCTLN